MMGLLLWLLYGAVVALAGAACLLPAPWSVIIVGLLLGASHSIGEMRARRVVEVKP